MEYSEAKLNDLLKQHRQLSEEETFSFACHAGLPCFNTCCADVNIILTPLDVLRLARRLDMTTGAFLQRYTLNPITKELQLPIVILKMGEDSKKCHFVGEEGCTVYEERPWACRMYPVGIGYPPARAGKDPKPVTFLLQDEFCKGHSQSTQWTVAEWRADQNVIEQDEFEAGYRKLMTHPYFIGGRRLDPKRLEMFYMACYDLDTFRRFVFDSTFLSRFDLEEEEVAAMREDDRALLRFAFRWLRYALFGEPTITVRQDYQPPRRNI